MSLFSNQHRFHTVLATLASLAYLTGEPGAVGAWAGYVLAALFAARLLLAIAWPGLLGVPKGWPARTDLDDRGSQSAWIGKALLIGIVAALTVATVSGIVPDRTPRAQTARVERHRDGDKHDGVASERAVSELHQCAANALTFRRRYALSMVFIGGSPDATKTPAATHAS